MEQKPGIQTSEFWLSALTSIVMAALAVAVGYGFLTQEQSELWQQLAVALIALVVPLAAAWTTKSYTESRTDLKLQAQVLEAAYGSEEE